MAQQIKKKFIGNDQVGASKLLIENGQSVRAMDGVTEVNLIKVDGGEVYLKDFKLLESSGIIDAARLPSYVDDVIEVANFAALPVTGESGKIYVTLDDNKCFRWSGSAFIQITSGAVDTVNGQDGVVVLRAHNISLQDDEQIPGVSGTTVQAALEDLKSQVDDAVAGADSKNVKVSVTDTTPGFLEEKIQGSTHIVITKMSTPGDEYLEVSATGLATSTALADEIQDRIDGDAAVQTAIDNHINDAEDAHDATAISAVAPAGATGITVQAVLNSLQANIDNVVGDLGDHESSADAHDAIAISIDAIPGVTGSTVQAGLESIQSNVDAEALARANADTAIQSELDATQAGAGLSTSGTYIQPSGTNFIDAATSLANADTLLDSAIKTEEIARIAADSALDLRVDALESVTRAKIKFDLDATNITNGYVDLPHLALANSIHAFVDRLAIHEGEDFTISVEGGVTRITFAGDLISPGQSQLDANDNIYVRYEYLSA